MSKELRYIRIFQIIFYLGITILFSVSFANNISREKQVAEKYAFIEAKASHNKDLLYRQWAATHGGVYVAVTEETPADLYLSFIDNRDISTPEKELTLVNPAYMTRQVFEIDHEQDGIWGHITSLNPIRPENAPDEWEKQALQKFEEGEHEYWSLENTSNGEYLRYMQAMVTEKSCLKCHAQQGYELNDIRGGISVSVPMKKYDEIRIDHIKSEVASHALLYLVILSLSGFGFKRFRYEFHKRNMVQEKLMESENGLQIQLKEYAQLNEEYRKQNNELKLAKEKAEESDRLKSTFIQNMSHEVRTPMNAICGFSSLLKKHDISTEKIEKYSSLVQTSTHQLLNIINDLLTISSLESNEQRISKNPFSIKELLNDLQAQFSNHEKSEDIILEYQMCLTDEWKIIGDRDKVFEVMSQLIKNAIKFTDKGKVTFGCHRDKNQVIFFVKDSGIGIPGALKERIFDRFYQGITSDEKLYGGNGLGLSIAKALVELMHGEINVESIPDEGSVFSFSIPYEKAKTKPRK